uniref:Sperm-associated antigen 17 n=1 Tax=Schistocephalus solidus TaxID=70667 RepID=A0A0X3PBU1_SCHSO
MHTGDLGFRAYLHTISDKIASWTKEQEAFYQAHLLSNEINMATQETDETHKSEILQKGPKDQTKTKTTNRDKSLITKSEVHSETVAEKKIFGENGEFIVEGSLKDELRKKAQQQQQQLLAAIEHAPTITEKVTRSKSAKVKTESKNARASTTAVEAPPEARLDEERTLELPNEQFWPFTGYDLKETVAHFEFQETSMFPSDGGSIRVQKVHQPHGDTSVKVTAITEGHTFTCHRLLPNSAKASKGIAINGGEFVNNDNKMNEQGESNTGFEEGMAYFTTYFSANLSNGVCLALTYETDKISPEEVKDPSAADVQKKPAGSVPIFAQHFKLNFSTPEGCQVEYSALQSKNLEYVKSLHSSDVTSTSALLEMSKIIAASPPSVLHSDIPSLYHDKAIELFGDNTADRRSCNAEREVKRILLGNGAVIQLLEKVDFESSMGVRILFPDGSVAETDTVRAALYFCENPPKFPESPSPTFEPSTRQSIRPPAPPPPASLEASHPASQHRASRKQSNSQARFQPPSRSLKGRLQSSSSIAEEQGPTHASLSHSLEPKAPLWLVTLHSGERFWAKQVSWPSRENSEEMSTDQSGRDVTSQRMSTCGLAAPKWLIDGCTCFHVRRMFDPSSGQTLCTRFVDNLLRVEKGPGGRDGVTVQHPDGTRQTTFYYKNGRDSNCQGKSRFVRVECPEFPAVVINPATSEMEVLLVGTEDTKALAFADPQGYFAYRCGEKSEMQFHHNGKVVFMTHRTTTSADEQLSSYVFSFLKSENLLEMTDSENNAFSVDSLGNCNALLDDKREPVESKTDAQQNGVITPAFKDVVNRHPQAFRFFSVSADGQTIIEHIGPHESARLRRDAEDVLTEMSSKTVGLPDSSASELSPDSLDVFVEDSLASEERTFTTSNTVSVNQSFSRCHKTTYMESSIIPPGLTVQNLNFALMNAKGVKRTSNSGGSKAAILDAIPSKTACLPSDLQVYRRRYCKQPLSRQKREGFYDALVAYIEHCLRRIVYWGEHSFSANEARRNKTCLEASLTFPSAVEGMVARTSTSDDRRGSLYNRPGSPHASLTCARFPEPDDLTQDSSDGVQGKKLTEEEEMQTEEQGVKQEKEKEEGNEQSVEQYRTAEFISRLRNEVAQAAINREILRRKFVPNYFFSPKGREFLKQQALLCSDEDGKKDLKMGPKEDRDTSKDGALQLEPDASAADTLKAKSSVKKEPVSGRSKTQKNPLVLPRAQIKPAVQRKYDSNPNFVYYWGVQDELIDPEDLCITSEVAPQTLVKTPNIHQAIVEDPYRLKVLNTGTVGRPVEGKLALRRLRGLRIRPEVVDLGRMHFGRRYTTHITLFNGGVEPANAWIRDPPKSLKLSVSYTKGQIPAGLSRKVTITLEPTYDENFLTYLDRIEDGLFGLTVPLQIRTDTHNIILPIIGKLSGDQTAQLSQAATVLPEINNGFAV